ncbi:MAG: DNA internalization-related competence protein ComEC/Rec2 [Phototrophicaceae bacterium]
MRLVGLSIAWVTGILVAASFSALIPLFWLIMMGVFGFLASYTRDTDYFWWMLMLFFLAFGGYRYAFVPQTSDLAQYNAFGGASIEGVIVSEPDYRDDRVQVRLSSETIQLGADVFETSGLVLVNAPRLTELAYGDRIRVTGELSTPAVYDTFSYADYLARQGVFSLMDRTSIDVLNTGEGNLFFSELFRFKNHLINRVNDALPDPEAALLTGILLGNERGIDPQLAEDFTRVGASHVIAISGFNMAIIAGLVMGVLEKRFKDNKWIATLIGIIILSIYTLLVGANAAVVRAAIMSSLLVIAEQQNRRTYVPASLAFVAILMSLQNPLVLWDLSFQLSFFAVLGLALFTDPLERRFNGLMKAILPSPIAQPMTNFLQEPIVVSVAALIMTLPLIVLYFGRLSLVSLLVNLLIVPVQAGLLLLGGLALIISLFSPALAQIFFWLDMLLLRWTISTVRYFGDLSFADIDISVPSYLIWGFLFAIIGGAIVNATRPKWAIRLANFVQNQPILPTISLVGLGILMLIASVFSSRPDGKLHIWFLDVGHSNAVFLQTASGAQILVDGGRFPSRLLTSIGDRMPFYDRELELVIVTHPDEFDIGALPSVLRRYNAGIILTNGQENLSDTYAEIDSSLSAYDMLAVSAGYRIELEDGTLIEVLHPQTQAELGESLGNSAMVLRISYGDVSFLLTSDLSQEGQIELLDSGQWIGASVIQLPQHATIRSLNETFIDAVRAQVAIAQYEFPNGRGDPDADVLALLDDETILFETGEEGTRHLWTDGRTLWSVSE